jgi:hypothetical protein
LALFRTIDPVKPNALSETDSFSMVAVQDFDGVTPRMETTEPENSAARAEASGKTEKTASKKGFMRMCSTFYSGPDQTSGLLTSVS